MRIRRTPSKLIRPLIRKLHPYEPGEQPKESGFIKLNTNENPFPPSPHVLECVKAAVDDRLRLYPNPTADRLREKLAKYHGCSPDNIIIGNGSDELLEMAVRVFVEPAPQSFETLSPPPEVLGRHTVQYFLPSYSLYPVLADMYGALKKPVDLNPDFSFPNSAELKRRKHWNFYAALSYITTPNAPTGTPAKTSTLESICKLTKGIVILDEAYADFAPENALQLALKYPHVIVSRTFSKAFSLCFLRVGYFVGHPEIIKAMHKVRDSYNVNGLGQVAAEATLEDLEYYRKNINTIIAIREQVTHTLNVLGFKVVPSATNFIFVKPPGRPAQEWYLMLKLRKILVRWFDQPTVRDYLRITIGTPEQMEIFLQAVRDILNNL